MKKDNRRGTRKFMRVFLAICSIIFLVISIMPAQAFGNEDGNGSMYGVITGIVTDAETNDPIPDTLMTLKYHDITRFELTDTEGQYTFTKVPICFCLKNVSASKSGFESQYQLVAVSEMTYANFSLNPESDTESNTFSSETTSGTISIGSTGNVLMISGVLCALLLLVIGAHTYINRKKSAK